VRLTNQSIYQSIYLFLHIHSFHVIMGGHSAWRKRLAAGMNAKGMGGAICRHRPHFGRKGKDLVKNRMGNIGGGNPKKVKKRTKGHQDSNVEEDGVVETETAPRPQSTTFVLVGFVIVMLLGSLLAYLLSETTYKSLS
jgi:hypothetical protein